MINILKAEEIIFDFRRKVTLTKVPITINNLEVEIVSSHKLLGTYFQSWLHEELPNNFYEPNGFTIHRLDRDKIATGKSKGGGGIILTNNNWCLNTKVVDEGCDDDLEFITIICRPHYLPQRIRLRAHYGMLYTSSCKCSECTNSVT